MPAQPRPEPTDSTTEVVAAALDHDPAARAELVARYGGLVRSVVASFRLCDADAADAAQNTWLRTLARLDSVRDAERLGGWLATVARRECLALLRRNRREVPSELVGTDLVTHDPGPEAVVLDAETRRAVAAAVAELADRRRRLVHALFDGQERSYAEVAQMTGMPMGGIGPTRWRVLQSLRASLEHRGFGADVA